MAQDLRSFLDLVKRTRPADFQIVSRPVDPAYETPQLLWAALRGREALTFAHHPAGGPVATELAGLLTADAAAPTFAAPQEAGAPANREQPTAADAHATGFALDVD